MDFFLLVILNSIKNDSNTVIRRSLQELNYSTISMISVLIMEVVMTAAFLFIIMGATDSRAPAGFAPIAIGLGLTLIHLISIPVSNTSVNPARSTGPALISMDATAISQLWMFWAAPSVGAAVGAILYKMTVAGTGSDD